MRNFYLWLIALLSVTTFSYGQLMAPEYQHGLTSISAMARDGAGNIYVAGTKPNATTAFDMDIVRLTPLGNLDPTFTFDESFFNTFNLGFQSGIIITTIFVDNVNSHIYVGGLFGREGRRGSKHVFRMNFQGIVDTTFDDRIPVNFITNVITRQPSSGRIIVGGSRIGPGSTAEFNANVLYRLTATGQNDTTFAQNTIGYANGAPQQNVSVHAILADEIGGGMIIGGTFLNYQGVNRRHIARIDQNGNLIANNFNYLGLQFGTGTVVNDLERDAQGNILIAGNLTDSNTGKTNLVRINATGTTLDPAFTYNPSTPMGASDVSILCDGKILVCGYPDWMSTTSLLRLLDTGAVDPSFLTLPFTTPGIGGFDTWQIILDDNENAIVAGPFTSVDGLSRLNIARFSTSSATLNAVDDAVSTTAGSTNILNVLSNDTNNGSPVTISNVTITQLTTATGIMLDTATGNVSVTSGTAAGTYIITYRICAGAGTCNCDTATVTVTVTNVTTIIANDDSVSVSIGTLVPPIAYLSNDTLAGVAPTTGNVISTWISNPHSFTFNAGGVTIPLLSQGTYTATYQICETANPTNCATATITVTVGSGGVIIDPSGSINASDDTASAIVNCSTTTAISDVLTNDTVPGRRSDVPATLSNVTLSFVSSTDPGITLDASTGAVSVSSAVLPGSYTLTYQICLIADPTQCDTATVTVVVEGCFYNGIRANNLVFGSGLQSDGKIIITGAFTTYNSTNVNSIARLNSNLTLDTTFDASGAMPITQDAHDFEIQTDDRIVLVGFIDGFSGVMGCSGVARLLPNGDYDSSFNSGGAGVSGLNKAVYNVSIQEDGKIIIAGYFNAYNGITRKSVARLNADGTLDHTFEVGSSLNPYAYLYSAIQPDGKIILAGFFPGNIVRVHTDGSYDTTFSSGTGINYGSYGDWESAKVILQPDGKVILFGRFNAYNGVAANNILRLNTDGSIDTSFNAGTGFNDIVRTVSITPDGKLFVGGNFTVFNGVAVNKIVRLNANGQLDNTFITGTGPSSGGGIWTSTLQPNGKLIIGGYFNSFNGQYAGNITRLVPSTGVQSRGVEYWESEAAIDINPTLASKAAGNTFSIYPNPSTGIFNIDLSQFENEKFDLVIHNPLGQLIYQNTVSGETNNQIDLTNFESGNYFIRLQNNNRTINKIITKK